MSSRPLHRRRANARTPSAAPVAILAWRKSAELTQREAAALVYVSERRWQSWESGEYPMRLAFLELAQLKSVMTAQKLSALRATVLSTR